MSAGLQWLVPRSLEEAVTLWAGDATVVGGGVALASAAFPTVTSTERMLDLAGVGLNRLDPPRIGAMVTLSQLVNSDALAKGWPAVWEAAAESGHIGVRRLATVGGTVAARLPGADLLSALCAYQTTVTIVNGEGTRTVTLATAVSRPLTGIITGVCLGPPAAGAYRRAAARAGFAPAIAGVAGVRRARDDELWAGAIGPVPIRIDTGVLPAETDLIGDERCSAWYRRQLLGVLRDEVLDVLELSPQPSHR